MVMEGMIKIEEKITSGEKKARKKRLVKASNR